MTAKPFSISGVMTLIRQTGIHAGALERLGLKRVISRRKSHQEGRRVRERMDSLSRTYRSIPTAGQNSQIWYLPVQLQPGGEMEDRVSKHMVLCREVAQDEMNGHYPPRTRVSYPSLRTTTTQHPHSVRSQKQTLVFWDQHGDGSWSPPSSHNSLHRPILPTHVIFLPSLLLPFFFFTSYHQLTDNQ